MQQKVHAPKRAGVEGETFEHRVREALPVFEKRLRMLQNSLSFKEAADRLLGLQANDPDVFNAVWHDVVLKDAKHTARKAPATRSNLRAQWSPQSTVDDFIPFIHVKAPARKAAARKQEPTPESSAFEQEVLPGSKETPWKGAARTLRDSLEKAAPGGDMSKLAEDLSVFSAHEDEKGHTSRELLIAFRQAESTRHGTLCAELMKVMCEGRRFKGVIQNEPELMRHLTNVVEEGHPLRLYIVWGGFKETKEGVASESDHLAMATLEKLMRRLRTLYPRTSVVIIFSDVHALDFAGQFFEKQHIYLRGKGNVGNAPQSLETLANVHGLEVLPLSEIYKHCGVPMPQLMPAEYERAKRILAENPGFREILEDAASRHSDIVKGESRPASDVALKYLARRRHESELFERMDPDGVFLSFGDPEREKHLSDLPTVFIYPRGTKSDLPWFTEFYSP